MEPILSSYFDVSSGYRTRVVRLAWQTLYLLSHLTRLGLTLFAHSSAPPLISEFICSVVDCLSHVCHVKLKSVESWLGTRTLQFK